MTRWLPVAAVALGLVLIGCNRNQPSPAKGDGAKDPKIVQDGKDDKPKEKPEDGKGKETPKGKADFTLTAEAFGKEFVADTKAAEAKYQGKTIEVSGAVWRVEKDGVIFLKGEKEDSFDDAVVAKTRVENWSAAGRVSREQKVKLVGTYARTFFGVGLTDCTLTELEPTKLLTVAAEDLAKEFEADGDKAQAKYEKLELVVTGVLDETMKTKEGGSRAKVKGTAKMRVAFAFAANDFLDVKDLAKGTKIELRNTVPGARLHDGDVLLSACILVKNK